MPAVFIARRPVTVLMIALCCMMLWTPVPVRAQAPRVVSACAGVSLPRSVVTDIIGPVITGAVGPLESSLNGVLGVVRALPLVSALLPPLTLNVSGLLANAAAGQPITLSVLDVNGQVVGPNGACETRADSFSLANPAGLSIGGNQITGLGAAGQLATAGELNSIAFGNSANTSAASVGAIAIGRNASVTGTSVGSIALGSGASAIAGNSLALGANSLADRGAQTGYTAFGLIAPQTSAGEVSFGAAGAARQLTNIAAGSAQTDAVNVAQLQAVADGSVRYLDVITGRVVMAGTAPVITGLSAGTLSATSTDAVNGAQLFATDARVTSATTAISNLTTNIANGAVGPVRYADPGTPTVPNGGTPTNALTLVGAAAGPVSLHNVAAASLNPTSTDAVNGAQVYTLASRIAAGFGGTTAYDPATNGFTVGLTYGGSSYASLQAVLDALPSTGASAYLSVFSTAAAASATGAESLALGPGATAAAANSAAIGAGSVASQGARTTYAAVGLTSPQTSAGEVSFGAAGAERQLTNVAAGFAPTDAVNVAQLQGVDGRITALSDTAVQYTDVVSGRIVLAGAAPVITNLSAGSLASTSTDAVNGAQIFNLASRLATAIGGTTAYLPATNTFTVGLTFDGVSYSSLQSVLDVLPTSAGGSAASPYLSVFSTGAAASATGADSIAVGPGATVTAANSAAFGSGSTATRGALAAYAALGLTSPQTSAGEVSFGAPGAERQLTNVAAGSELTDAVNLGQLMGVDARITALAGSSVLYTDAATGRIALGGTAPTITNLSAGTVSATSTDAVNGAQLFATNGLINGATTAITNLTSNITNGAIGPVRYSDAAAPTVPNGGTASNNLTLVGAAPGAVGLHNIAGGSLTSASTDAVNGGQFFNLASRLATGFGGATAWDPTTNSFTVGLSYNGATYASLQGLLDVLPTSSGGASPFLAVLTSGGPASVTGAESLALGPDATTSAANSVALGAGSDASRGALVNYRRWD